MPSSLQEATTPKRTVPTSPEVPFLLTSPFLEAQHAPHTPVVLAPIESNFHRQTPGSAQQNPVQNTSSWFISPLLTSFQSPAIQWTSASPFMGTHSPGELPVPAAFGMRRCAISLNPVLYSRLSGMPLLMDDLKCKFLNPRSQTLMHASHDEGSRRLVLNAKRQTHHPQACLPC